MGKMIKFDHVNEHGDFVKVLAHFDLEYLTSDGKQLRLLCPFHDDTNPSLSVTTVETQTAQKNTWYCHACQNKGSIIDFVALHEDIDLRAAAELVAEISGCALAPPRGTKRPKGRKASHTAAKAAPAAKMEPAAPDTEQPDKAGSAASEAASDETVVNPPLRIRLPLDQHHEYVTGRVPAGAALTFGVGVCDPESKSMMAGRCCVPIHDVTGQHVIGYAGRYLGDDPAEPKWKFPPKFGKHHCLYNAHRVVGAGKVVLVEGFFDVIRLHSLGIPAVAAMGTAVSAEQVALLPTIGVSQVVVLFDGDDEGQAAVPSALSLLTVSLFTRVGSLPVGEDPASVEEAVLVRSLASAGL